MGVEQGIDRGFGQMIWWPRPWRWRRQGVIHRDSSRPTSSSTRRPPEVLDFGLADNERDGTGGAARDGGR